MITAVEPVNATPASTPTQAEIISDLKKTVSASRLSLYLSCGLRFYFRYVLGLTKPKSAALHVGSSVHSALKAWNKARWRNQPLTLKELHDEFTQAWGDTEQPVEWEDDEAEQKATAWKLIEIYTRQADDRAKPEFVEVPVEAELKGLPKLIGIIDLVQNGRIVDYKTSGQTPNAEKVAHTNEIQTSIYSLLYRENAGRQEAGIEIHTLVKTKNPKVIITELPPTSQQQQSRLFRLIDSYVDGLDRDFVPAPGLQCAACDFWNECRRWS